MLWVGVRSMRRLRSLYLPILKGRNLLTLLEIEGSASGPMALVEGHNFEWKR